MQVTRESMKPQDFAQSFVKAVCKRQSVEAELFIGKDGLKIQTVENNNRIKLYEEVLNKLIFGNCTIRKKRSVYNAGDDDFVMTSDRDSDFFEFSQWLTDLDWHFMSGKANPHCHPRLKPIGDKPAEFIFSSGNVHNCFTIVEK